MPTAVPFERAGIDEVQHLTGAPEPGGGEETDLVARILAGWDTIDAARMDFVVQTTLAQGIEHTPTLVAVERLLELGDPAALRDDPAARMLPRYYREVLWAPGGIAGWSVPALAPEKRAKIRAGMCEMIRRLHQAGAVVHVGSDSLNPFVVPGAGLHQELRSLATCGFTLEEVWRAATRGNGEALALPGLGWLAAGAPADLLIFERDPSGDASALASLRAVVSDGRLYPRGVLEEAVARYRAHHESWLVERITGWLFALFAGA